MEVSHMWHRGLWLERMPFDESKGDVHATIGLQVDVDAQLRSVERAKELGLVDVEIAVFEGRVQTESVKSFVALDPDDRRPMVGQ